ncbi:Multicopper oxidase mco [bacterium HR39]|nr:Multicopper oxidase mco [bacterium HR39]
MPAGEAGTYWYHPHAHGCIARQMWMGLAGGIVIRGPAEQESELALCDDRLVVLRDLGIAGDAPAPHMPHDWHTGKEGPLLLANGRIAPDLQARADLVRLRLVNAANARTFRIARADGRPLVVIALDGRLLAEPVEMDGLELAPGQRADLLVAAREEPVELVAKHARRGVPSPRPRRSRLLRILPARDAKRLPLPRRLGDPAAWGAGVPVAGGRRITMAMFLLDGRPYRPGRIDVRARLGTAEIWRVVNVGTMHHPFHLHTWPFRPLSRNGRPWPFPCVLDTVDLAPGDEVELLVPFTHNHGTTVYHCHIAEHGDRGMMGTIRVDDGLPWQGPVGTDAICGFRGRGAGP